MKVFDVVVIGAGPAGSIAANDLASRGFNVALLDKKDTGWEKPCGGAFAKDLLKEFDISPKICYNVNGLKVVSDKTHIVNVKYVTVYRNIFDEYLASRAKENGASLLYKTNCLDVIEDSGGVSIKTNNGRLRSSYLIGSDGANSIVREKIFPETARPINSYFGLEYFLEGRHAVDYLEFFTESGSSAGEYNWIFPRDNKTIVVGALGKNVPAVKKRVVSFLKQHPSLTTLKRKRISAGFIPATPVDKFNSERCLLVGDAAGLVIPIVWGGVPTAMRSGRFAAKVLSAALDCKNYYTLNDYSKNIFDKLGSSFIIPFYYWKYFEKTNVKPSSIDLLPKLIYNPKRIVALFGWMAFLNLLVSRQ